MQDAHYYINKLHNYYFFFYKNLKLIADHVVMALVLAHHAPSTSSVFLTLPQAAAPSTQCQDYLIVSYPC